jgi:hypothetical protein
VGEVSRLKWLRIVGKVVAVVISPGAMATGCDRYMEARDAQRICDSNDPTVDRIDGCLHAHVYYGPYWLWAMVAPRSEPS